MQRMANQRGAGTVPEQLERRVAMLTTYLDAAKACGLELVQLKEWWHAEDVATVPRLLTLVLLRG